MTSSPAQCVLVRYIGAGAGDLRRRLWVLCPLPLATMSYFELKNGLRLVISRNAGGPSFSPQVLTFPCQDYQRGGIRKACTPFHACWAHWLEKGWWWGYSPPSPKPILPELSTPFGAKLSLVKNADLVTSKMFCLSMSIFDKLFISGKNKISKKWKHFVLMWFLKEIFLFLGIGVT